MFHVTMLNHASKRADEDKTISVRHTKVALIVPIRGKAPSKIKQASLRYRNLILFIALFLSSLSYSF